MDKIEKQLSKKIERLEDQICCLRTELANAIVDISSNTFREFNAVYTQTGTNDPVVTVLRNTFNTTPTITRGTTGTYSITALNEFSVIDNVFIQYSPGVHTTAGRTMYVYRKTASVVQINTFDAADASADEVLLHTAISIRVYN